MSHTVDEYYELTYEYNADGIRTHKSVYDTDLDYSTEYEYIVNGTQIVAEIIDGNTTLIYLYDENGSPIGMKYRTSAYDESTFDTFFFEKNLQGDIIAVYDSNGTKLITYTYDAWGKFKSTNVSTDYQALHKASHNPFRYRGYYYDTDTGWYYLQTRYYNPTWGRFINADGYVNANGTLMGFNIYAYCDNNPVMFVDYTGEDAYLVIDYDELPIVGHALVFFEDEDGVWYRSEVGKHENFSTFCAIFFPIVRTGQVYLNKNSSYKESGLSNYLSGEKNADVHHIKGDFSNCYEYAEMRKKHDFPYLLPSNNCLTYALDLLSYGEIEHCLVRDQLMRMRNMQPQIPALASINIRATISLCHRAENVPARGAIFGGTKCVVYR